MLSAIIVGSVIGFVLAMPPGPIAMANIKLGLEQNRRACVSFSLGTATMDLIYCLLSISAASAIYGAISGYFDTYPIISIILQLAVVIGLILFGIRQFKSRNNDISQQHTNSKTSNFLKGLKEKGPLFLGISLAFTNLANPTFLPSLTVMSTWIHKIGIFPNELLYNVIFSLGFGIGNFLWLYILSMIVIKNRHKLTENSIFRIKQFAGATFIGFGGLIGYRVIMVTNWASIFKFAFAF